VGHENEQERALEVLRELWHHRPADWQEIHGWREADKLLTENEEATDARRRAHSP
jgi:hypothetical protein